MNLVYFLEPVGCLIKSLLTNFLRRTRLWYVHCFPTKLLHCKESHMFTSERLERALFQEASVLYLMTLNKTGGSYVCNNC